MQVDCFITFWDQENFLPQIERMNEFYNSELNTDVSVKDQLQQVSQKPSLNIWSFIPQRPSIPYHTDRSFSTTALLTAQM